MALASSEGWLFLLRWIHFFAGVIWIGLLYYFNFVQTPFFAETAAGQVSAYALHWAGLDGDTASSFERLNRASDWATFVADTSRSSPSSPGS